MRKGTHDSCFLCIFYCHSLSLMNRGGLFLLLIATTRCHSSCLTLRRHPLVWRSFSGKMTPPRRSLQTLLSRIDPARSLSAQESRQLLSMLKVSFRRHLDADHPPSPSDDARHPSSESAPSTQCRNDLSGLAVKQPSPPAALADQHFRALLSHPLMALKPMDRGEKSPVRTARGRYDVKGLGPEAHDPMAWFDEQTALGTASQELAGICLAVHARAAKNQAGSSVVEEMRRSRAGTRVVRWLWSSSRMQSIDVIHDRRFIRELVPFLVVEGRDDVIWEWLRTSNDHPLRSRGWSSRPSPVS